MNQALSETQAIEVALGKIRAFAITEKLTAEDVEAIFESGMFVLQGFSKRLTPTLTRFMSKS